MADIATLKRGEREFTFEFLLMPKKYLIDLSVPNLNVTDCSFQKHTLKKLILDSWTKTIFSCNRTLYEQLDSVSMVSSLGPVLANIILSEFENVIVSELVNSGVIKLYRRCVDDTFLLIRPSDIQFVLDKQEETQSQTL